MEQRAIELLALKLAQAEANLAIMQAQLEQLQTELNQLKEGANDGDQHTEL